MKKLFIPLAIILAVTLILVGCGGGTTTTTPAKTTAAPPPQTTAAPPPPATTATPIPQQTVAPPPAKTTTAPPAPPPQTTTTAPPPATTPAAGQPVYGGVLRMIASAGPTVLSYVAEMGPNDHSGVFPAAENLVEVIPARTGSGVEPWLCENVVDDAKNLKITWYLRKGIKFHDGTEMTAEVVKWNFQMIIDGKALPYGDFLKDMQVVDNYTLVMNLTKWSNQLMPSWGYWPVITSKAAYDKASGGDPVKGKEWQRANIVGTGPFTLKEYKRDDHITWVKNPNYWRPGRPYLDGIEVRIIPDSVTARSLMEAKQADHWPAPATMVADMEKKGFIRQQSWAALPYGIWPNTSNPNSKFAKDKRLREAVEYAIDKAAIAKAIGAGLYTPLKSLPWQGEWGYDANYNPRPYNPAKAKQLLAEAGYPNGLKIKMLTGNDPVAQDAGTGLKQLLDAAGFQCDLDVADPGRFFGTIFWKTPPADVDMHWWLAGGMDTTYLQTYMRWFSNTPFTDLSFLGHTPEQIQMDGQALLAVDPKEQEMWTGKLMKYLTDNALVIPVYLSPAYVMQQPWVHSTQYTTGFTRWDTQEIWMDKH